MRSAKAKNAAGPASATHNFREHKGFYQLMRLTQRHGLDFGPAFTMPERNKPSSEQARRLRAWIEQHEI
jgi:hypothetical protein